MQRIDIISCYNTLLAIERLKALSEAQKGTSKPRKSKRGNKYHLSIKNH